MRLFRFGSEAGQPIAQYGSERLTMTRIVRSAGDVRVGCMYLDAGGLVGYHQALTDQLFLVVRGDGWVRGELPDHVTIHEGEAAFWQDGEWHAAGSETGMVAIVIEASPLNPEQFMLEQA